MYSIIVWLDDLQALCVSVHLTCLFVLLKKSFTVEQLALFTFPLLCLFQCSIMMKHESGNLNGM